MMVDATRQGVGGTRQLGSGAKAWGNGSGVLCATFLHFAAFFKLLGAKMFAKYFRHLSPNCS